MRSAGLAAPLAPHPPRMMPITISHPIVVEDRLRISIENEERALRDCLLSTLHQRLDGLRYKPAQPVELLPVPEGGTLLTSANSGSFYNTPATPSLVTPAKHDEQLKKATEAQRKALMDTGDIDAYLKQMQRKHVDDYRKQNNFAKVHYQHSKATAIKVLIQRALREEEENRNDLEIVEILMHQKMLEVFHGHRYSLMMSLQEEEEHRRIKVCVEEVEALKDVLISLRNATDALEVSMITEASSPQRAASSGALNTPLRSSSDRELVRHSSSASRGSGRRRMSHAVDERWIESYLSAEETRGRNYLMEMRDILMDRLSEGFTAQESAIVRGEVEYDSRSENLRLLEDVPEIRRRNFIRGAALVLEDEEELIRYQINVLYDQDTKRMHFMFKTLCARFRDAEV